MTERAVGPVHPQVTVCLRVLSLMHSHREDYDRAIPELQRALTIAEATLEPGDFGRLAILNNLGDLYSLSGDDDRAEPFLTRALDGIEKTFGPDDSRLAVPLKAG